MFIRAQRGYIGLALVVFLIVFSLVLYPFKFPSGRLLKTEDVCIAGSPGNGEILTLPAINKRADLGGGAIQGQMVEFIQIRKDVRVLNMDKWFHPNLNWTFFEGGSEQHNVKVSDEEISKPGYELWYPGVTGEIGPAGSGVSTHAAGIIFFRSKDPSSMEGEGANKTYLVDIYQEKAVNDQNQYTLEQLFPCIPDDHEIKTSTTVTVPDQSTSQFKDQLQLEWFVFTSSGAGGRWAIHCKPAIYLYPKNKQLVNVKVYPKGELSYTDPPYDPVKGWGVEVYSNGALYQAIDGNYQGVKNNYLYYESKIYDSEIKKPTKGWVVKKSEMEILFNEKLPLLGLNEKEAKDFKDYWLSKLPESPYYFVGLVEKEQRDYLERLDVTPNPETSIRFSFFFEMLDQPKQVEEPVITTPKRNGFTLVDWGGMVKLHPGTPFTCSQ